MVTFNARDLMGADQEVLEAVAGAKEVGSDEEYREFIKNNSPPDGYVWGRTPFGASPGNWQVHVKEEPEIRGTGTDLEQQVESYLTEWDYRNRFQHDYRHLGYQLDFADTDAKIALEPGAAYWHTPDGCAGETNSDLGDHPEEVYSPPTTKDCTKHQTLTDNGWQVLWIAEDGVENEATAIKKWLDNQYNTKSDADK